MDYYQGVVVEYLRADRSVFVNTEFCLQLNGAGNPDSSGPHWYCDALAVNLKEQVVYLCEISYSRSLGTMLKRLADWNRHWDAVQLALTRDAHIPGNWPVRPWLFIPERCVNTALKGLQRIGSKQTEIRNLPQPRITTLEAVAPWNYASWNRQDECKKPELIPVSMQI